MSVDNREGLAYTEYAATKLAKALSLTAGRSVVKSLRSTKRIYIGFRYGHADEAVRRMVYDIKEAGIRKFSRINRRFFPASVSTVVTTRRVSVHCVCQYHVAEDRMMYRLEVFGR